MKLIIATGNKHKVLEYGEILGGKYDTFAVTDFDPTFDPFEDGNDFASNAMIKAKAAYEKTGLPCIADDSGICVDALGGEPGIYSARYAPAGERKKTVLRKLEGVPKDKRTAHFACAIAYVDGTTEFVVEAKCFGRILEEVDGEGGFGYDPIFFSDDLQKSFGRATEKEKNSISHRGRAVQLLLARLEKITSREHIN